MRAYALKPGYRSPTGHAGARATDAWPFRGRRPAPAPERLIRVAVLGDSCVYGIGVRPAGRLEEVLAGMANAPGAHELVVQSAEGVATRPAAVRLPPPRFESVEARPLRYASCPAPTTERRWWSPGGGSPTRS